MSAASELAGIILRLYALALIENEPCTPEEEDIISESVSWALLKTLEGGQQ